MVSEPSSFLLKKVGSRCLHELEQDSIIGLIQGCKEWYTTYRSPCSLLPTVSLHRQFVFHPPKLPETRLQPILGRKWLFCASMANEVKTEELLAPGQTGKE